jgi:hypothetical protein
MYFEPRKKNFINKILILQKNKMTKQIENIKLTKEQKQLLEELFSKDERSGFKCLNRIEEVGNVVFIKPLLELYFSSLTVKEKKLLRKFFQTKGKKMLPKKL